MSHRATNWAIAQRGLKPAVKLVLWHLADRHHPDYGCFPSQETLAYDCEISRSALNNYLKELERRGLIRRIQRSDKSTHRQKSTYYQLGFEFETEAEIDPETAENSPPKSRPKRRKPSPEYGHGAVSKKPQKPCPKNAKSRVQNLDTNPVREPVKKTRACARPQFFTEDEKFKAQQVADFVRSGGPLNPAGVPPRIRGAIRAHEFLNDDEIRNAGLE